MSTDNILRQAIGLCEKVLQVSSGLNLPKGAHWQAVVTVFLNQANERLYSIKLLLDNNLYESGAILTRSIFELAVNLVYISKDNKRLRQYLKHGGIPFTIEEVLQLQQDSDNRNSQDVRDILPKRPWKTLKDMCCDLGSQWLKEYETFYPYVSVPTHSGSFTFGRNYMKLLTQQPPSDLEKATILLTALDFHLRIVEVSARVFSEQINIAIVKKMRSECLQLGKSLSEQR